MKKTTSHLFLFLALFFLFSGYASAEGENCETDILSGVEENANWEHQYIVKGSDGSAWQRAIISSPKDLLILSEGEEVRVEGTAGAFSDVQIFLFFPKDNGTGGIKKPDVGNCFGGGKANENGFFSIPINARSLWGNLGTGIIIDVFFRMEQSWDQMPKQETNQNFYVGTGNQIKKVSITAEETNKDGGEIVVCEQAEARDEEADNWLKGIFSDWTFNSNLTVIATLDPQTQISEKLIGTNFDAVGGNEVTIARYAGPHTFYAAIKNEENPDPDIAARVVIKSIVMETIKRKLMGNSNVSSIPPGAHDPLTATAIKEAAGGTRSYSAEVQKIASLLKDIMTTENNIEAAKVLAKSVKDAAAGRNSAGWGLTDIHTQPDFYLELFPNVSTEEEWAKDLIDTITFWTKSASINNTLVADDAVLGWNFLGRYSGYAANLSCGDKNFVYSNGVSPRLLLHTLEEVSLVPDFNEVQMVYSEREFDSEEVFVLPEGEKEDLYYRYLLSRPIVRDSSFDIGEACLQKSDVERFANEVMEKWNLRENEKNLLMKELQSSVPLGEEYVSLGMVDPKEIDSRFGWKGNGKDLDILNLFFKSEVGGCEGYSVSLSSSFSASEGRDGFQVGVVE